MSTNPSRATPNEEPEIGFEESIPLDGPDPVGEKMIEDLGGGKRAEKEPPSQSPPSEPLPEQFPAS
ncbi:hypothetical protein H6CHR_03651 [Variovorax sp. PBL-H6]|uniref:hypothetical protein n=1 Tax=Variovorax sp. PBL-H6 TaxID=434009 RepID=UPI001318854C|nr:hypothetical protein [Variovorax sp. PBL-H6]VTU31692.1 hypothetical protein H6CHR_03651 [Variovorax sp. PBL-H6]